MTYKVTIEVYCDAPGCDQGLRFTRENSGGLSASRAGYMTHAQYGWYVQGGPFGPPNKAYCPEHSPSSLAKQA